MDGTILRLPNARPAKYAKVSLAHVENNNNHSITTPQLSPTIGIVNEL